MTKQTIQAQIKKTLPEFIVVSVVEQGARSTGEGTYQHCGLVYLPLSSLPGISQQRTETAESVPLCLLISIRPVAEEESEEQRVRKGRDVSVSTEIRRKYY